MENQGLQRKEHATALIATLTNPDQARAFERGLTIKKAVEVGLPVTEIVRLEGFKSVAQAIDIALVKLVASLNIKNNLNDGQIKTIVEDLIEKYPNESIEDFVLVFKMARQNEFGTTYQTLDQPTIFGWMEKYLEKKYEQVEANLMSEKEEMYRTPKQREKVNEEGEGYKLAKKYLEELKGGAKVPNLTEEEIQREGQRKSVKKDYNPMTKETLSLKLTIDKICAARYRDLRDFTGYKHFPFGEVTVFAKDLETARDIFMEAESNV